MRRREVLFGLFAALILAIFLSPFASPWPDGLERVAEDKGFIEKGEVKPAITSPIPDYIFPRIANEKISTSVAGFVGTLVVFGIAYMAGILLGKIRIPTNKNRIPTNS